MCCVRADGDAERPAGVRHTRRRSTAGAPPCRGFPGEHLLRLRQQRPEPPWHLLPPPVARAVTASASTTAQRQPVAAPPADERAAPGPAPCSSPWRPVRHPQPCQPTPVALLHDRLIRKQ